MNNDLISRQAVIDFILNHAEGDWWFEIEYDTIMDFLKELPALKRFKVIDKKTGKEADPYEIALNEKWAQSLCYCDMEGFFIGEDGTLILADECGKFEYANSISETLNSLPDGSVEKRFEVIWEADKENEND